MGDKQNPNDPQYDWLYAGAPADGSDEPTRAVPRPDDPGHQAHAPSDVGPDGDDLTQSLGTPPEPEQTQVLDVPPGPLPDVSTDPPPAAPPTAAPSFGGTYPAPPPPSAATPPRYATPAAEQRSSVGSAPPAAPPRPTTGRPSRGFNKRKWIVGGLIALLAAWLIFLIAVPIWSFNNISKIDAEPAGDNRPPDTPGTTYLLVGSDQRADLSKEQRQEFGTGNAEGNRTDSILLLHVPDGDGPRLLLSIPRDSFVDIPGHGENKINAAYSFGGPKLLVETIEQATDVRIDNYIEIGFAGFVDVVDAVGGITICPDQAIDDPKAGGLKLEKGCQEVDGVTALGYARSRHSFALGDIARAQHQREVIAAVGDKALSWQTFVFPWRYLAVNKAAAESLQIGDNVGMLDLARFFWAMSHTGGSDSKRCVVPYSSLGASTSAGSSVIWDEDAADKLFADIRQDDTSAIRCTATGQ
jgi:LCP family protein required for cell wall assembly